MGVSLRLVNILSSQENYIRLVVHGLIFSGKVVIDEDIGTKCERSDGDEYRVEVRWILQSVKGVMEMSTEWRCGGFCKGL
ncbi:hypothetical protein Tco_1398620 [Tanacetum coccineum]